MKSPSSGRSETSLRGATHSISEKFRIESGPLIRLMGTHALDNEDIAFVGMNEYETYVPSPFAKPDVIDDYGFFKPVRMGQEANVYVITD